MKHRWLGMASELVLDFVFSTFVIAQNAPTVQKEKPQGPYARIGFFRALDGHWLEMETGYVRHLDWHRRAKDPWAWYGYAVLPSTERQAWILYATVLSICSTAARSKSSARSTSVPAYCAA